MRLARGVLVLLVCWTVCGKRFDDPIECVENNKCHGIEVDCCGFSGNKYSLLQCRNTTVDRYTVCDYGDSDKLYQDKRGVYEDELTNSGNIRPRWKELGANDASYKNGRIGWTNRMWSLVSKSNSQYIFRNWVLNDVMTNWPAGMGVWFFIRFGDPPQIAYRWESSANSSVLRLSLNINNTVADHIALLGNSLTRAYVIENFEEDAWLYPEPAQQFLENITLFGAALNGDPTVDRNIWIAWMVAGETTEPDTEIEWTTYVEIHDPVAMTIYIIGAAVLLTFCIIVWVLVNYYPARWQKIVGFFWDRGAPKPPEDDGFDLEDSCDEDDLLDKTEEELQLAQLDKELKEKEAEARRIRQQQHASGDRDTIEHSDEEEADENVAEANWTPTVLFEKLKQFVESSKEMAQYDGKEGMDRNSLIAHAKVFSDKIKKLMEFREHKEAGIKKKPSRKTRKVASNDVQLSNEIEETRAKKKELEGLVKNKLEEKKRALMQLKDEMKGKITNFMKKLPLPMPKMLGGRRNSIEEEDEANLINGAVVEVPFEQCLVDLKQNVVPCFKKARKVIADVPNNVSELATYDALKLIKEFRQVAGEIDKSILQYVPTFCHSLERAVTKVKEDRAQFELLDTFDAEKMKPLKNLETQINKAREEQREIMKCIKDIQRMARVKSCKYSKAKGARLLSEAPTTESVKDSDATPELSPAPDPAPVDPEVPEVDIEETETMRELAEAEKALEVEKERVEEESSKIDNQLEEEEREAKLKEEEFEREVAEREEANRRADEEAEAEANETSLEAVQLKMEEEYKAANEAAEKELEEEKRKCEEEKAAAEAAAAEQQKLADEEAEKLKAQAAAEEQEALTQQAKAAEEAAAEQKKIEEEAKKAEEEAAKQAKPEEKKGGFGLGGLKAGLAAGASMMNEKLDAAKKLAEEKRAEAMKKLEEERKALEAKHADKLAKLQEMRKEAEAMAEAKKAEMMAQHGQKLAELEAKKNMAMQMAEEKKAKALAEFEEKKKQAVENLNKLIEEAKELARKAREDRAALLAELKDKANSKKEELKKKAMERVEQANQKRKELQEALKDRDKLIADLRERARREMEELKAKALELADKAKAKALELRNQVLGGSGEEKAQKDLEVFIYNLKKASLSSIRPALASAIADVKGMIREAEANEALFIEEAPNTDEVKEEFDEGFANLNIGSVQSILKTVLKKLKALLGKGQDGSNIQDEECDQIVEQLTKVRDFSVELSDDLKTKVVEGVTQLRNCLDGDIPELGSLAGSVGTLKALIVRGHSLGKVVSNAYGQMNSVLNFQGAADFTDVASDVKNKAAAQIRHYSADDPPEVRDAAFIFKVNERQIHWEKELSREVMMLSDKLQRSIEEGNTFNQWGAKKKKKKSIWDPCMIKKSTKMKGDQELAAIVVKAPDPLPGQCASYVNQLWEMTGEFENLLQVAWKDVCEAAEKLSKAEGPKMKDAKKAFLHAAQRVEAAVTASTELVAMALKGMHEAGFPVDVDFKIHIFTLSRAITRKLNQRIAETLGIKRASIAMAELEKRTSKLKGEIAKQMAAPDEEDPSANNVEDLEAQNLAQPARAWGDNEEPGEEGGHKKKKKKSKKYENLTTKDAFLAMSKLALEPVENLGKAIQGTKKYNCEKLASCMTNDNVKFTIDGLTVKSKLGSEMDEQRRKARELTANIWRVVMLTAEREVEEELKEGDVTIEQQYIEACKLVADGNAETGSFKERATSVIGMLKHTSQRFEDSMKLVSSRTDVDVFYMGAYHLAYTEIIAFLMEYRSNMAQLSIALEVSLRERKEKIGVLEIPLWKERNQAQAREFINNLREEFLNGPLGAAFNKAAAFVGEGLQKAGAFMASIDKKFGISEKVEQGLEQIKEKAEELKAKAKAEIEAMRERTKQVIESNPELKQRLDVIKKKAEIFNDKTYDEETAKLRTLVANEVQDEMNTALEESVESLKKVLKACLRNNKGESQRDEVLSTYLAGVYDVVDTDVTTFLEMECCVAEFTQMVEMYGITAELKLRESRSALQASRAMDDFKTVCDNGAISVKDIAAVCLEILQDYWSDSIATDSKGRRRSTVADDDVALGLDCDDDPRVLYMKTMLLKRVSDATQLFYVTLRKACVRLQKLVVATKNVEKTFFYFDRALRLNLQELVGDTMFDIQQKQQKEWNTTAVTILGNSIEGALVATKEKAASHQCTQDGDRVLDVKNTEDKPDDVIGHVAGKLAGSHKAQPPTARILGALKQFSAGVTIVIKNQSIMAFQLVRLKEISFSLKPAVLCFDPVPPLQVVIKSLGKIPILPPPQPSINPPCSWKNYFQGMIGGLKVVGKKVDVKVNLKRPTLPLVPLDPQALPVPLLFDRFGLLMLRGTLYLGILMERFVGLLIEAVKVFFNIVMMQAGIASLEIGQELPDFDAIKLSMKDNKFFLFLSDLAYTFSLLFNVASPFSGLASWNCGGAIKALTPLFLLFGFFVVLIVLKKDLLLTMSVGILKLKIEASEGRKWVVSRAGKIFGILCLYAVQFVVVSSVGLLFGDVIGSRRSCNSFDRIVQVYYLGVMWVGVWCTGLMYLCFFVFVGEPVNPPRSLWMKAEADDDWDTYQSKNRVLAGIILFIWSILSGAVRLVKQTLGYWDADVVDAHKIVSRADQFDDDPNDDDNRHELLVTILGKANAIFWLFIPGIGPALAKFQEAMNDPIVLDLDGRLDDQGLHILTSRQTRFFKWVGAAAKYSSSVTVVTTATTWAASFTFFSLIGDFFINLFNDVLEANEVIHQLTSPPK